jgi:hypothetical protein
MRALLATLVLACAPIPSRVGAHEGAIHLAQMARDVTDAVRKQRAERRARSPQSQQSNDSPQSQQSNERTKR